MLAVYLENRWIEVRDRTRPKRRQGFALIRVTHAGICNTDLELHRGYYSFRGIPGHEFVGEVEAADDKGLIGKRVVGEINLACGKCDWCARGLGRHCPKRSVLGIVRHPGAMSEYLTLPQRNLHVVPNSIISEHAVFVEPLAAACEILDQVRIPRGDKVAVLGDGKLGLLVAQVLCMHGANVHHFGRHKEKLRISENAGAATEVVQKRLPVREYEYVVDATGSSSGLMQAVSMARPRGTVIMKSTVHDVVPVDTARIIVNEITLVGSRCGRFGPAIKLLAAGKIDVDSLISDTLPLSRARQAFATAARKGVMKVLLQP
jgi:threonine dehydrogenase-like Zn-dependent dehydrogenase